MKKVLGLLALTLLVMAVIPLTMAVHNGGPVDVTIHPKEVDPHVWMCGHRILLDDNVEEGRILSNGLIERTNNYAFEGEQIEWEVLVMDKNKIGDVSKVYAIIGDEQDSDEPTHIQCEPDPGFSDHVSPTCNAKIDQLDLTGTSIDPDTQSYYKCVLTVPNVDEGQYWVSVEAIDGTTDDHVTIDENDYWYLNPIVTISMDGSIDFDNVMPGTDAYSDTFTIKSGVDPDSGVLLDTFISGTDFTGGSDSLCLDPFTGKKSNVLVLGNGDSKCDSKDPFCYFASMGAYSTLSDNRRDAEGYVGINYGDTFSRNFYGNFNGDTSGFEIMQTPDIQGPYFPGNILNPGSEISITFRLRMPEPCMGNFDSGHIYIWGEAI